ncbi:FMN-dependent NADH-azoreductase [Rhizohabitans arisaemae]|uniref:FMN-dependent NADH-azoreductase n=1 Tax=Rhizohabitans arisaemae TaxID=2720610 RepID=UPI0024B1B52A|nr:NAD(P)H-dependent oxidoreductase [Rhizohabitans arisaemae]
MPGLLHIDSSMRRTESVTREVTAAFVRYWRRANPLGDYVYRDLGALPVPHLDEATVEASLTPETERSSEQRAGWAVSEPLIEELRAADTLLLGVPMYNFTIPSALKAWVDRVVVKEHMVDPVDGSGLLVGKRVVVVAACGGSYSPGAPRAEFDHQLPYLRAVFSQIGLDRRLEVVRAEMTLAYAVPGLAPFKDLAETSRKQVDQDVRGLALAV